MYSLITCFPSKSKTKASNSVLVPLMKTKSDDGFGYRKKGQLEKWKKNDPVASYEASIIEKNQITEKEILKMKEILKTEIDEAFKYAKDSPFPELNVLNQHIYKN
mgnify:CR=1 FL=1